LTVVKKYDIFARDESKGFYQTGSGGHGGDLSGYIADRIKAGKITLSRPTLEGARSKRLDYIGY
jgi:hypothetical protein